MGTSDPKIYVITAAGGNPTAIKIIETSKPRDWYEREGKLMMNQTSTYGVEQAGFLVLGTDHFEMSGGEFCGNAARSAAMLFASIRGVEQFTFTMSGYSGIVKASVTWTNPNSFDKAKVKCAFTDLSGGLEERRVLDNTVEARVVDLGGIVHAIIEGCLPTDYEGQHRQIMRELGLLERDAVGVIWIQRFGGIVHIEPVVWVRAIDTFFHETACGSGSIAVAIATGESEIEQPSGQQIVVEINGNSIELQSEMEVTFAAAE